VNLRTLTNLFMETKYEAEKLDTKNKTGAQELKIKYRHGKLGHYFVGDTLGEGTFSKVKLGIHEKTGDKVALKLLKTESKQTPLQRKQVVREIQAMAVIDHPNVLKIKEVCTYTKSNGGKPGAKQTVIFMVLELASGGDFLEFLSYTGCFDEYIARTYFKQLMAGMEHCHSKGVIHRDLKPDNLLLDDQFTLKIADFGLSNIITPNREMLTICGTPEYRAPEMIERKKYDGAKCDIWSCGVILFLMLTGIHPWQKPHISDWWFEKLANNKHALFWESHSKRAYFSEQTKDFINKLLCVDPEKRISISDMKKHPWWTGPTITPSVFNMELQDRKARRDTVKEKIRKNQNLVTETLTRGEESSDLPDLSFKHEIYITPKYDIAKQLDFRITREGVPLTLDSAIVRYTRFLSSIAPSTVVDRICEVLTVMGAKALRKDHFKIKAQFGTLQFIIQVFSNSKSAKLFIVDFRRKKGTAVEFRSVYQEIRAQLGDIVYQPVPKEEESDEESDEEDEEDDD